MGTLLLNSKGLNTLTGCRQILEKLQGVDLSEKTMFLVSLPDYGVDALMEKNCVEQMGFKKENLYFSANGIPKDIIPDYIFVTEGNTFEVLKYMRDRGLVGYIQDVMKGDQTTYIGSSAGALIAGSDIMLARDFDSNFVRMYDFTALGLFDGTILPHFESDQLENYLRNTEEHILNRYTKIMSVSNTEVVVIE